MARRHANKQERSFLSPPEGSWIPFGKEMLDSPAWRALSRAGHQFIGRLCSEHAAHGGRENGRLAVSWEAFAVAGVHRSAMQQTEDEVTNLGFVECVDRGRKGYGSVLGKRATYRLTFLGVIGSDQSGPPTDDWRAVASDAEAEAIITAVRNRERLRRSQPERVPTRDIESGTESRSGPKLRDPVVGTHAA